MPRGVKLLAFKVGVDRAPEALGALFELLAAALSMAGRPGQTMPGGPPIPLPPEEPISGDAITVTEGTVPADLAAALRRYWPPSLWHDAARVSYVESGGWNTRAVRDTRNRAGGRCNVPLPPLADGTRIVSEWSIGYFQINACAHGGDFEYWSNADNNVRKAYELYQQSGWRPWTWTAHHIGLL